MYINQYKNVYNQVESNLSILCKHLSDHLEQKYEPVLNCPKCNIDMVHMHDYMRRNIITCIKNVICNTAIKFNRQPNTIDVLKEKCSDVSIVLFTIVNLNKKYRNDAKY